MHDPASNQAEKMALVRQGHSSIAIVVLALIKTALEYCQLAQKSDLEVKGRIYVSRGQFLWLVRPITCKGVPLGLYHPDLLAFPTRLPTHLCNRVRQMEEREGADRISEASVDVTAQARGIM